jgi:Glutathione S-transferase, C-terminal domain
MASSRKPTLTYFDFPLRCEPLRHGLRFGKIEFIDERLSQAQFYGQDEAVLRRKAGLAWGMLPTLTLPDGRIFGHLPALARYVSRVAKLDAEGVEGGDSADILQMKVDEIVVAWNDIMDVLAASFASAAKGDVESVAAQRKRVNDEMAPLFFRNIEATLKEFGGGKCGCGDSCSCGDACTCGAACGKNKFLVGEKMTMADIVSKCLVEMFVETHLDEFDHTVFEKAAPRMKYWFESITQEFQKAVEG